MTIVLVLAIPIGFALFPMWMDKLENAVLSPQDETPITEQPLPTVDTETQETAGQ